MGVTKLVGPSLGLRGKPDSLLRCWFVRALHVGATLLARSRTVDARRERRRQGVRHVDGDPGWEGFEQASSGSFQLRPRKKRAHTHHKGYLLADAVGVGFAVFCFVQRDLAPTVLVAGRTSWELQGAGSREFKTPSHEEQASTRGRCRKLRSIRVSVSMDDFRRDFRAEWRTA